MGFDSYPSYPIHHDSEVRKNHAFRAKTFSLGSIHSYGVLVVGGSNPLTPTNPSSSAPQHGLWSFFVTLKNGKIPPKMDDTGGRSIVFLTTSIMILTTSMI